MKTAMILAAGRGERLRPLTYSIPKAMCDIKGTPLIEYHVRNLANEGFERVIINHAYLGDAIRHHFFDSNRWGIEIIFSPEPPGGLETGGGIFHALPLLGTDPFLTVNADIYTDFKFSSLVIPESSLVHLAVGQSALLNTQGDFGLNQDNLITPSKEYTFLGIAIYRPETFLRLQRGRYSITPRLRQLINEQRISGEVYKGCWMDIGTPERLALANRYIITPH